MAKLKTLKRRVVTAKDYGTEESDARVVKERVNNVAFNRTQLPIDYYLKMNQGNADAGITPQQHEAAEKFFSDFYYAGILPSITPVLEQIGDPGSGSGDSASMKQIMARRRWREAMESIHPAVARTLAVNVVCFGFHLKDISREIEQFMRLNNGKLHMVQLKYFKATSQMMPLLRIALDDLAKFYGIPDDNFDHVRQRLRDRRDAPPQRQ